jgi:hypothetical protein
MPWYSTYCLQALLDAEMMAETMNCLDKYQRHRSLKTIA